MRRYQFRMEPVLRVRRVARDSARAELAAAETRLHVAEGALHDGIDRYRSAPADLAPQPAAAWLARRTSIGLTAATVVALGAHHEAAGAEVAERLRALHDARRQVLALERLDERRRAEHEVERRREEDADADELSISRWGRAT